MSDELQTTGEQELEKALAPDSGETENPDDGAEDTLEFLDEGKSEGEPKQDKSTGTTLSVSEKAKQIDAWTLKILKGEKSLDDLPPAQKWLEPMLKENLKEFRSRQDVESIVKQQLQEEKLKEELIGKEKEYLSLVTQVTEMDLSNEEKAVLSKKYKGLKAKGISKEVALSEAVDYLSLYRDMDDSRRSKLRKAMSIPRPPADKVKEPAKLDLDDPNFSKQGNSQSRVDMYEARLKSKGFRV